MGVKGDLRFCAIGIVRSPFVEASGAPIQSSLAAEAAGTVHVLPEYAAGLADLAGFDRIWLIYSFHRAGAAQLKVRPYLDDKEHGIFATRAPSRPNPIGISCVRLERIEGHVLHVTGIDVLDGTPLLDIKPYVAAFDAFAVERSGWYDTRAHETAVADDRFHKNT
jgi:tRNA (adenine37-N6)-methyltransferase